MSKRFRLSLQFMKQANVPFEIEFFTNAIEANAYDIAFYLLNIYEEEIFNNATMAIEIHVKSYKLSKQNLKSKLHMSM